MNNVIIRRIKLPAGQLSITLEDNNGDFNIYINSLLQQKDAEKAFWKEANKLLEGLEKEQVNSGRCDIIYCY